jgi:hypothetical protein
MNLRTFLIIAALIALFYGVSLLLVPSLMLTAYGLGTSASELLLARYFGAELLGVGIIQWLAKDLTGASVRPVMVGGLTLNVVGALAALAGTLGGVMSVVGWSAVLLYFLVALGFAYFQFMAPVR